MGCDIHSWVEVWRDNRWTIDNSADWNPNKVKYGPTEIFDWRSYGMFGFLADVRNYSCVPGFKPKGFPPDAGNSDSLLFETYMDGDYHSWSWLTAAELTAFDYDQEFEDRRYTKEERPGRFNGAAIAEKGQGTKTTFREFLGPLFFEHIKILSELSPDGDLSKVRVVFAFDN